jgi:hypothetical protein
MMRIAKTIFIQKSALDKFAACGAQAKPAADGCKPNPSASPLQVRSDRSPWTSSFGLSPTAILMVFRVRPSARSGLRIVPASCIEESPGRRHSGLARSAGQGPRCGGPADPGRARSAYRPPALRRASAPPRHSRRARPAARRGKRPRGRRSRRPGRGGRPASPHRAASG